MARLPYVDPADAPPPVREALDAIPPLGIFRMVAHAETAFRPWLRLGQALLAQAQLDDRLRELAILQVAKLSQAEYEWVQHVAIAKAVGATDEEVAALEREELDAGCFEDAARLVLSFTTEVVRDVGVSDATFARAREAFSPREIVELTLTVGFYMMAARVMEVTRLDPDPPAGTAVVGAG